MYVGMQYGDCEYVCMWECSMEIVSTVCVYVGVQYGDCEYSMCVCGNAVWRL